MVDEQEFDRVRDGLVESQCDPSGYEEEYDQTLKGLVGSRIVEAGYVPCEDFDDDKVPVIILELPDGSKVSLLALRDPEGNGPGWLEIQLDQDATTSS